MCGIAGIFGFGKSQIELSKLHVMLDSMVTRGPDDSGFFAGDSIAIGMRRLSIIDLAGGHQPISNEDDSIHLVMNGEIYNYKELQIELKSRGHKFKTDSDVEVLLHLYEDHGLDAVRYLRGMFGFALWDSKKKRLWLGRDRLGIKPLVYATVGRSLYFASTVEAVRRILPEQAETIDDQSFLLYLALSYVPAPRSMIRGISKLRPGHTMVVSEEGVRELKYWDIREIPRDPLPYDRFHEELDSILSETARLHMRSDVPIGSSLSGGLDSSSLTALLAQMAEGKFHTFSKDFEGKMNSELEYADMVARQYATAHFPSRMSLADAWRDFKKVAALMDEPIADSAIVPSYAISGEARKLGVNVLVSGAGGDEVFGGYFRHFARKRDVISRLLPDWGTRPGYHLRKVVPARFANRYWNLSNQQIGFALSTSGSPLGLLSLVMKSRQKFDEMLELLNEEFKDLPRLEKDLGVTLARMQTDLTHYLPNNILALLDQTTMAVSIEGRVPFVDHVLVEFVFRSIDKGNLLRENPKSALKNLMKNYLPREILDRPKVGFNGPTQYWMNDQQFKSLNHSRDFLEKFVDLGKLQSFSHESQSSSGYAETSFQMAVFNLWTEGRFS